MNKKLNVEGAYVVHHDVHVDNRGYFCEYLHYPLNKQHSTSAVHYDVQNVSRSCAHTLRGLHFQEYPGEQSKFVTCLSGKVYDFFVDLRRESPSYLCVDVVTLNSNSLSSVYVPRGVAHGFYAPVESVVLYGVSGVRVPKLEVTVSPFETFKSHVYGALSSEERRLLDVHGFVTSEKDRSATTLEDYVKNKTYVTGGGLFD